MVNRDQTLVLRMIGYKMQEMVLGSHVILNLVLEEDQSELEEMVVVGYGEQKKEGGGYYTNHR